MTVLESLPFVAFFTRHLFIISDLLQHWERYTPMSFDPLPLLLVLTLFIFPDLYQLMHQYYRVKFSYFIPRLEKTWFELSLICDDGVFDNHLMHVPFLLLELKDLNIIKCIMIAIVFLVHAMFYLPFAFLNLHSRRYINSNQ